MPRVRGLPGIDPWSLRNAGDSGLTAKLACASVYYRFLSDLATIERRLRMSLSDPAHEASESSETTDSDHGLRYSPYEIQDRVRAHHDPDADRRARADHQHRAFRLGSITEDKA